MNKTKMRKCELCGAILRTGNKGKICSSHNFPCCWDPIGDEIRRRNKLLKETGVLSSPRTTCEVMPPISSTLKRQKITFGGITYEFLTSEI